MRPYFVKNLITDSISPAYQKHASTINKELTNR